MSNDVDMDPRVLQAHRGAVDSPKPLFGKYLSFWDNLLQENRILRATAFASLAATMLCLGYLATQGDRTRTFVVPFATGSQDLWIIGDTPSDDYLRAIARNIVSLLGTFTAATAEHQFDELLAHVHPSKYDALRIEWRDLAERMLDYREVAFATYIRTNEPIVVFEDRLEAPVTRLRFVGGATTRETGVVHIEYVIEHGRFWMTGYEFRAIGAAAGGDNAN